LKTKKGTEPRFYWDWQRRDSSNQSAKFCGTPPLAHIAGLETAIALLEEEGLPHVWARHQRLAGAVHAAVERWAVPGAMRFHARQPETRSASVTAIEVASGIDPEALRTVARERFQVAMAGGLGPLAGRVFRIGHLGDLNEPMIIGTLGAIEMALGLAGVPHAKGGVQAALDSLAA
jgi:alanine-glyoxylate transaminase/serine-glyoxylate transaminase/serine-pyruvate transaminase